VSDSAASPPPAHPHALERALGLLTALPVALIVTLTFVDVFARYVFSAPVRGSVEIIEQAMALVIFTALPLVTHHRQHVSVGLLDGLRKGLLRRVKTTLCDAISTAALALMTWRLAVQALDDLDSRSASVVLNLPHAPLGFAMTVLAALSTLVMLALTWRSLTHPGARA
jgi:TRAP-type transport system small permease protein